MMVARKSRKNAVEEKTDSREQICKVAGYVRLSVVKERQSYDSIATQTAVIENYIDKTRGEMLLHKVYVDEKLSGANFERKGFQEMLSDIENGIVNCVIVKDLSRLGRDFLETGYYIEQYFPSKSVRFVSIADEFDTTNGMKNNKRHESMNGIRIPMSNLFNERYVEDIRNKTQSTVDYMIHHGKCIAPRAPYGYMKDPADCHALLVDPESAAIVKHIFLMADKGCGLNQIVRQLNTTDILPPLEYTRAKENIEKGTGQWNTRSVKKILTNRVYAGDLIQGKKNHLVEDTHEALVDREMFTRIQRSFSGSAEASKSKAKPASDNPLKGKVICGCCGGKMQRRRGSGNADWHFFTCITNNRMGAGNCSGMYIRESAIMATVRVETSKYADAHKHFVMRYKQDKAVLDEKLCEAKRNREISIEQFIHSFEQSVLGKNTQEEYDQCVVEKEAAEQAVQVIESNAEQLEKKNRKYQSFCHANTNSDCLRKVIQDYLCYVSVKESVLVTVCWNDMS